MKVSFVPEADVTLHHPVQINLEGSKPVRQKFKSYPIGYFHIDIAELQTAEGKFYLLVAIDRTSNERTSW